ncbi:MAG: sigma-70 family RNA polymerase sigma factor [Lachnospiraceae bacterium]|nr:sigma-70 family RNA polymerase sigma factor [Lachnospiraceae bacterium]
MDKSTMEKLAAKAMRGNVKAYGRLMEEYKTYLYRTAFLYVKNEDTALDIVGDCILSGFRKIHTLNQPEYFKTWITRILINAAKDHLRKVVPMEDYGQIQMPAPVKGISPEEKWDLYEAIDQLPDKYRSVIILKYFEEMKISEISYAMEIPEGSVKAYLSRAKEELRNYLKEDYQYAN